MTDNEAMRTTFVSTRPALHKDEDEAEAGWYKAEVEAENFSLEATLASLEATLASLEATLAEATLASRTNIPLSKFVNVDFTVT